VLLADGAEVVVGSGDAVVDGAALEVCHEVEPAQAQVGLEVEAGVVLSFVLFPRFAWEHKIGRFASRLSSVPTQSIGTE